MVQDEILKFIEKSLQPLSAKQIEEALEISKVSVSRALKKLIKYSEVNFYEMSSEEAKEYLDYQINRRVYVYYPLHLKVSFS